MMRFCLILSSLLLFGVAHAAELRTARLLWSGTELFPQATVVNSMSCQPCGAAKIGDITMPAIFLHPQNAQKSLLTYPPLEFLVTFESHIFLLSYVGVSDGFDWQDQQHKPDGVRFYLQYAGKDLASAYLKESKWAPLAAPLALASEPLQDAISLATDPGPAANCSYDWVLFGQPVVVNLPPQPLPAGAAVAGCAGVLVVDRPAGPVTVEGLDAAGQPVPEATATTPPPTA